MQVNSNENFGLLVCVVEMHKGHKIVKKIKNEKKLSGATILLGKGTGYNKILEFLGMNVESKEILLSIDTEEKVKEALECISSEFKFVNKRKGVGFILPVTRFVSASKDIKSNIMEECNMIALFTIVKKGRGDLVVECTKQVGAKGGTIIKGRGSATEDVEKIFNIEIEPEKEIVLTVTSKQREEEMIKTITQELNLKKEGEGIVFSVPVVASSGLVAEDK